MKPINEPPIKEFGEVGPLYPFACNLDGEKHWLCVNDMLEMHLSHPYWNPMGHFLMYLKDEGGKTNLPLSENFHWIMEDAIVKGFATGVNGFVWLTKAGLAYANKEEALENQEAHQA